MMKLAVSVVDLDASSKGFAELHLGTGEAEAFWLGRDLETAAVPLHDVVIADDALVDEAADAAEIFGGRAPSLFRFSGSAAEAAVVVGQEAAQDIVGGDQIGGAVAAQQVAQQVEIPASIFGGKELSNGNLAGGVVQEAEEGELWAAIFEPAMKAAIEEEHFALPSAAKTSLAVRRSAPFLGGTETVLAEQTAESLPTE